MVKNIMNIVKVLIVSVFISFICNVDFVKDNHFNLITVNSVLIGFLFTSFSILLTLLSEEIVQIFEGAGALKKVYLNLTNGIKCSLISIIVSLVNMTIVEKYIVKKNIIIDVSYSVELILLILTIYFLFCVIKDIKDIVDSIRDSRIQIRKRKKANDDLLAKIDQLSRK